MSELFQQLSLMVLEAALAAAMLLGLFRARAVIGLAPMYTTVGVFYYLATLLAASTFVQVSPSLLLSPGSVALFPASLFAVLLVYIREDAREARNMIYGLLAANVAACLIGLVVSGHLSEPLAVNRFALPPELFVQSPRLFVVGTLALFADAILIILAYEAVSRVVRPLFLRIAASLAAVLVLDALVFVTGGFVEHPAYGAILASHIVGKLAAAAVYAAILAFYLPRDGDDGASTGDGRHPIGGLFQVLTYRQKYEALQRRATRDPLTGVHNRGFCDDALRVQLAAARRSGRPVTVALVDIDHFKRINDTLGHAEGDRALQVIAQALTSTARASDIVCRYGGEEFCVILPATPLESAVQLGDRLRTAITAACLRADVAGGTAVTATIGLAAFPADGPDLDMVMRVADRRMYAGKDAGRNQVVAE